MITSEAQLDGRSGSDRTSRRRVDGIRVIVIHEPYSNHMGYAARLRSFARFAVRASWATARTPTDVIVATSPPLTIAIPALIGRFARRVPMVFEVRDLWPEMPITLGALKHPLAIQAARALEWAAYHGASRVITLAPGMTAGVVARGIPPDRVTMIPNACDTGLFAVPASAGAAVRRSIPGLGSGDPLIVYAGAIGRVNGVAFLADIAAEIRHVMPQARFLVIGDGAGRAALLERAAERGVLNETLFVRDPVPKHEMPAILAASTAAISVLVPIGKTWTNSANKFFDALAAGRPVIVNYEGWLADILTESAAGICIPSDDAPEAARIMAAFLSDAVALKAARVAAQGLAEYRFDRDVLADRFAQVLEAEAAGEGHHAGSL